MSVFFIEFKSCVNFVLLFTYYYYSIRLFFGHHMSHFFSNAWILTACLQPAQPRTNANVAKSAPKADNDEIVSDMFQSAFRSNIIKKDLNTDLTHPGSKIHGNRNSSPDIPNAYFYNSFRCKLRKAMYSQQLTSSWSVVLRVKSLYDWT